MYSKFSLNFMLRLFHLACITGWSPLVWNPKRQRLEVSFLRYIHTAWSYIMLTCYTFLVFPNNILLTHQKKDSQQFTYTIVVFLCTILGELIVSTLIWKVDELLIMLNGYFLFLRKFRGKYALRDFNQTKAAIRYNHFVHTSMVLSTIAIMGSGLLIALHYFIYPKSGPYLTYQIPDMFFFTWIYVFGGIMFLIPSIGLTTILSIMACIAISFFAYMRPIYAIELKLGLPQGKYRTLNKLRHPTNLVLVWRMLELFVSTACISFGFLLIPFQIILTQLTLFCNVTLIIFTEELETTSKFLLPLCSLNPTLGWALFLTLAGNLFVSSKATLGSWKIERWSEIGKERKFMKRFKKSCRPLSVCAGKFFVVRPKSALNYLKGVSRGTFRSLIAMRKALNR